MVAQGERRAAAEVLANAKAKTARVRLCLDGHLLDEHAVLSEQLEQAQRYDETTNDPDTAPGIAQEIVALEARIAEEEVEFVFRGLGRGRWRTLLADHPPSEEQVAQGAVDFDPDVFPFEAMAASLVEPTMTADELSELNDEVLDEIQFNTIWGTCLRANLGNGVNRPESVAARNVLASVRPSSVQPSDSESRAAS
jgi:hypothetical protein